MTNANGELNVQCSAYDAEGRLVKTVTYATPIDLAGLDEAPSATQIEPRIVANAARDSRRAKSWIAGRAFAAG